jgi:DNA-directed RNA polymerase subunit RPC12/RpoP
MEPSYQFRFVVDRLHAEARGAGDRRPKAGAAARRPEVLEVPSEGPSCLVVGEDGAPRVMRCGDAPDGALVIEPILAGTNPELLLVSRPGRRPQVNGQPAPLVALLSERDQVQVSDEIVLHVTTYHQPRIGPPAADQIGRTCPVCRTAITKKTTMVYACWRCGAPMHLEGKDRLDCARVVSACPSCSKARILLEAQYTSFPEEVLHE